MGPPLKETATLSSPQFEMEALNRYKYHPLLI